MANMNVLLLLLCLLHGLDALTFSTARIRDVQRSITTGELTCRQIVQGYLDRIRRFDRQGPNLQAVITVNDRALADADVFDDFYRVNGRLIGALHCATMVVKDNIDVAGLPTTNGLRAFAKQIPKLDADTVANARRAGAIVVGKANMSPLADKEAWGNSETGGLIRNPFGSAYTTYGSSGGNGAAGAAVYAVLGLGSETGVSVNLPSSAANLVGLRAPVSMLSQNGVMPNSAFQDVVGPIAKSVEDVAKLIDAIIGARSTPVYASPSVLRVDALRGAKLAIFRNFAYDSFDVPNVGKYKVDEKILTLFNQMVANMVQAGASVQNKSLGFESVMPATLAMMTADTGACQCGWRDGYFSNQQRFGPESPFHSCADVAASNQLPAYYQTSWSKSVSEGRIQGKCQDQTGNYMRARTNFISTVLDPLLEGVDVAFWPAMPEFPPLLGEDAFKADWGSKLNPPINMILAGSWAAYATIDVPLGFSDPTSDAPDGRPIGAIFIAKPANLARLIGIAYAYQETYGVTKTPRATPESAASGLTGSWSCFCAILLGFFVASSY